MLIVCKNLFLLHNSLLDYSNLFIVFPSKGQGSWPHFPHTICGFFTIAKASDFVF